MRRSVLLPATGLTTCQPEAGPSCSRFVGFSTHLWRCLVCMSCSQKSNLFRRRAFREKQSANFLDQVRRFPYFALSYSIFQHRQNDHQEVFNCKAGHPYGTRRLARICTKVSTQEREWQDYEDAVECMDLERALELLKVLNTLESDNLNLSTGLVPSTESKKVSTHSTAAQTSEYLKILDACPRTSDLALVGKAYDWLAVKNLLPSFGKFKASASEGERWVTEAVLVDSTGLGASKLSPKKWGLSGDSAIFLALSFALFSYLVNNGIEVRPVALVITGLGIFDALYLGGTSLGQILSMWLPYKRRVIVHEAGHVLVAYLLGCPIRGVVLDPVQAMKMGIQGQAGTQFWDEMLEADLSQGRLTGATVDRYSIVLFAGIAAEALIYGEAEGGESDENLFKSVVSQLQPSWSPAKMSNQARWAVVQAFKLLKEHKGAHIAVVKALDEGAGLRSMIKAIEEAIA